MYIAIKEIEPCNILFIRRAVQPVGLQVLFTECFPKLFAHATDTRAGVNGRPLARYVNTDSDAWTIDCAIPVLNPLGAAGEIELGSLQTGPVAAAIHIGDYSLLTETNAEIGAWIDANGYTSNGPNWESYIDPPNDTGDYKTEVLWPIKTQDS